MTDRPPPGFDEFRKLVLAGEGRRAFSYFQSRLRENYYWTEGMVLRCLDSLLLLLQDEDDDSPPCFVGRERAQLLRELAMQYAGTGQPQRAVQLTRESNGILETVGDRQTLGYGRIFEGELLIKVGDLRASEKTLRDAIALCDRNGDLIDSGIGHAELGRLYTYSESPEADEHLGKAESILAGGCRRSSCDDYLLGGKIRAYRILAMLFRGDARAAASSAERAWDDRDRENSTAARIRIRELWSRALVLRDKADHEQCGVEQARALIEEALARCEETGDRGYEPQVRLTLARVKDLVGNADEAEEEAGRALDLAGQSEQRLDQADIHGFLAQLHLEQGRPYHAFDHAHAAGESAVCDGPPYSYERALQESRNVVSALSRYRKSR